MGNATRTITTLFVPDAGTCGEAWKSSGDDCFLFTGGNKTWIDAEKHCEDLGATLPIVMTIGTNVFIRSKFTVWTLYIQSFQMTEYFSPERALSVRLCVCVCMCVCMCVCVSVTAFYLNTIGPILMKLELHDLNKILRWHFSQILKMLIRWRHSGHFICFRMRHSQGRNFA